MSVPWRTRRGFGTTATFVLVIIGISLLILLGGDMLSRGSRVTIERAYITGQLLRVANMALDEAMAGEVGREKLGEQMLAVIADGGPVPPKSDTAGRDTLINSFLQAITPYTANNVLVDIFPNIAEDDKNPMVQHEYPWGDSSAKKTPMKFWRQNGRVVFGIDASKYVKFSADTLKLAYKAEIDNGTLKVQDVEMRPVAFRACLEDSQSGVAGKVRKQFLPDQIMGFGMCRARVTVGWLLPRAVEGKSYTLWRTVTSDRFFELQAPKVIGGSSGDGEWVINMMNEWQREAIGD